MRRRPAGVSPRCAARLPAPPRVGRVDCTSCHREGAVLGGVGLVGVGSDRTGLGWVGRGTHAEFVIGVSDAMCFSYFTHCYFIYFVCCAFRLHSII